jgi:hypothetical protein
VRPPLAPEGIALRVAVHRAVERFGILRARLVACATPHDVADLDA